MDDRLLADRLMTDCQQRATDGRFRLNDDWLTDDRLMTD